MCQFAMFLISSNVKGIALIEGTPGRWKRLRPMYFFHSLRISPAAFAVFFTAFIAITAPATDFHPPAGEHYVATGTAGTILPGGRILRPMGTQIDTGPGPSALAVSHNGTVATAD